MDLIEKEQLIKKGKGLFESNVFPNEIIESQRDKRLREEISKGIFSLRDSKKFDDLSSSEKNLRKRQLKIQLEFINYTHTLDRTKPLGFIYAAAGIIWLIFAVMDSAYNIPFAVISIIEGAALIVIFRTNKQIIDYRKAVLILLSGLVILEFAIFQLPVPILTILDSDLLANKHSAMMKIVNQASPFLYLTIKVSILGFIYFHHLAFNKFFVAKEEFEKGF